MPEQVLRGRATRVEIPDRLQRRREPRGAAHVRGVDRGEAVGSAERVDEQVAGAADAAALQLLDAQREPEAAQRETVQAAERARDERCGGLGRERDQPERDGDDLDQRTRGAIGGVVGGAGGDRRDAGDLERPRERLDQRPGADDDRLVGERHVVLEMPFAEQVRYAGRERAGTVRLHRQHGLAAGPRGRGALGAGERGADALGDLRDEPPHRLRVPVDRAEAQPHGCLDAEPLLEPAEQVGLAAAEGVGSDVGVAERDDRAAAGGQRGEQADGRLPEVLHVVDHDQSEAPGERSGPVLQHRGGRQCDELGGVERVGLDRRQHLEVLAPELGCGAPLRPVQLDPEVGEADGSMSRSVQRANSSRSSPRNDRVSRTSGPSRSGHAVSESGQQLRDQAVLVAAGEQHRGVPAVLRRVAPRDVEGEGGGACAPAARRPAVPTASSSRSRSREACVRRGASSSSSSAAEQPAADPIRDEGDRGGRAAGARRAEHDRGGAGGQREHRLLVGVEGRGCLARPRR